MNEKRSSFTGKIGFVLAAAGSAVGLGNIWRFPYLAAQHGGGIFLLVYIILAVTFGFTLMTAEITLGRKTGLSVVGAFKSLNKKYSFVGYLAAIVPMIILPYYSVIGGWVTKYMVNFIGGNGRLAADSSYFGGFISQPGEPLLWFALFIGVTALVVLFEVDKGIEAVSKVMMPILVLLSMGIAIYSLSMPGAIDGLLYYITPDFSKFSVTTVLAALGQLFYSMSLAMGIMITYGSYMKKQTSIESAVGQIEIFDTGIAFLAGLMIIPAIFATSAGNTQEMLTKGPGLMFVVLPQVFDRMPGGQIVGTAFFVMVLFAALTSSISLMETVVSIFRDKLGWNRKATTILVLIGAFLLGVPSSLGNGIWANATIIGMDFLTFFDFISNSVIMPIVALLTCIIIGYFVGPKFISDEIELSAPFKRKKLFNVMIKYIAPIGIVFILIFALLEAFGIITV